MSSAHQADIGRIEDRLEDLPLIDTGVYEIISLLNNPDSNFEQIVDKLSPDLAARFLKMANSAYYGREVRSLSYAVTLLGYAKMKQILVSSILLDHFTRRITRFNFDKFQRQARFCAVVSRTIGKILNCDALDDLYTVSILHNIGKLVIAVYFKAEHAEIIALKTTGAMTTRAAEVSVLGMGHAEIGYRVLKRFNVPEAICDAVRRHDQPAAGTHGPESAQLRMISAQSAAIVGRFVLPDEPDLASISKRLPDTIAEGKARYREMVASRIRSEGYDLAYPELLTRAAELVLSELRKVLAERDASGGEDGD